MKKYSVWLTYRDKITSGDWAIVECHPCACDKQEAIEKSLALWYLDSGSEYKVVSVTEEKE